MNSRQHNILGAAVAVAVLGFAGAAQARIAPAKQVSFTNAEGQRVAATLFAPEGRERRPAVIMMAGCAAGSYDGWAERLAAAGYVALLVDSDTPRGAAQRCDGSVASARERAADAEGAHRYLARSGLAEPDRVGLIGWSEGASGVLAAVDASHGADGTMRFRAAVAIAPDCALDDGFGGVAHSTWRPATPVRIVHGAAGAGYRDWSCIRRIARAQQLGAPAVSLVTRPEVDSRAATPAAQQVAAAEAIDLFDSVLKGN